MGSHVLAQLLRLQTARTDAALVFLEHVLDAGGRASGDDWRSDLGLIRRTVHLVLGRLRALHPHRPLSVLSGRHGDFVLACLLFRTIGALAGALGIADEIDAGITDREGTSAVSVTVEETGVSLLRCSVRHRNRPAVA